MRLLSSLFLIALLFATSAGALYTKNDDVELLTESNFEGAPIGCACLRRCCVRWSRRGLLHGVSGHGVTQRSPPCAEEVIDSADQWLIEFFAPVRMPTLLPDPFVVHAQAHQWCGHCKALAPEWQKAATQLKGTIRVGAVDCDVHKVCGRIKRKQAERGSALLTRARHTVAVRQVRRQGVPYYQALQGGQDGQAC